MNYREMTIDDFEDDIRFACSELLEDVTEGIEDRWDVTDLWYDYIEDFVTGNDGTPCAVDIDNVYETFEDARFIYYLVEMGYELQSLASWREDDIEVLYSFYYLHDKTDEVCEIIIDELGLEF